MVEYTAKHLSCAIILNGDALDILPTDNVIICADGGYKHIMGKLTPDYIIGDMDSIDSIPSGIKTITHNPQKNYTDGELSLRFAIEKGYNNINIYSALGGRIDHTLGNISLLALADKLGANAAIKAKDLDIYYVTKDCQLPTKKGDTISVIPFGGDAKVDSSKNLYYPLDKLHLLYYGTRGVSNVATADSVSLAIQQGAVLVVHYH